MIEVARSKVAAESLANARLEVMSSESLGLPDESVDAVIPRFGLRRRTRRLLARGRARLRKGGHVSRPGTT